jgi:hypothetical protein
MLPMLLPTEEVVMLLVAVPMEKEVPSEEVVAVVLLLVPTEEVVVLRKILLPQVMIN